MRFEFSQQENELLKESLLTEQQVLVDTGMLLLQDIGNMVLSYKIQQSLFKQS